MKTKTKILLALCFFASALFAQTTNKARPWLKHPDAKWLQSHNEQKLGEQEMIVSLVKYYDPLVGGLTNILFFGGNRCLVQGRDRNISYPDRITIERGSNSITRAPIHEDK